MPIAVPEFDVQPFGATSLLVSWKELPSYQARGVIADYKIFYRKHEERPQVITVPSDVLKYEITGKRRFRSMVFEIKYFLLFTVSIVILKRALSSMIVIYYLPIWIYLKGFETSTYILKPCDLNGL